VPEHRNLRTLAHSFLPDFPVSLIEVPSVAVGHEEAEPAQFDDPLVRRISEKVVIACHIIKGDAAELLVDQLTSLEVAGMQEHVKIPLFGKQRKKNIILRMCIADDQNLHL
jgi:hypothetical protein